MSSTGFVSTPSRRTYDVVIVGGAMMGSAAAWFLTDNPTFDGSVLVVERDPSYAMCSTAHSNSCMRQQFSNELNVRISQYAAEFVKNFRTHLGGDERIPDLAIKSFGYMYLAGTEAAAEILRENCKVQRRVGAKTDLMTPDQILADYPFYRLEDIVLGSINLVDEGYWDGATVFDWWRRQAQERGVDYLADEVVAVTVNPHTGGIGGITLKSGGKIGCGHLVNASGPRAAKTAAMAGVPIPVEPRRRFTWVFRAAAPLERDLPLTIDPSGVYVRENGGGTYQCGAPPRIDCAVGPDDFDMDPGLFEDRVWPILAARIPQFETIKVQSEWAGHYAMNTFDQNAIIGPHPEITNLLFMNGFSGHGLQQSPAMGRAISEWIAFGEYRSLDMAPLAFDRIGRKAPFLELAII